VNNYLASYIEYLNIKIKDKEMKKIISFVLFTLILVACSNPGAYNMKGKMGDGAWDDKQVILYGLSNELGMVPIDSTIIKDGVFNLKGKVDSVGWCLLLIKNNEGESIYKDFYMDGNLKVDFKNGKLRMTGNGINDSYQAFVDKYDSLSVNIIKLNAEQKANPSDKTLEIAFNEEYEHFEESFRVLALSTIMSNLDNPLGLHIFQAAMSSLDDKDLESILAKAGPEFLADPSVKMVSKQLRLSIKVGIGCEYVDLALFDPDRKPVALSEYVGKGAYVLIDFWASWCGPCMAELPNVITCYNKYHKKGFDIVGVSLDKEANLWKEAIRKNKISWPQMSDLAGWQSQAVTVYSFSSIPHTVLVDPQGIIIAKDLRGEALNEKLSELLDK